MGSVGPSEEEAEEPQTLEQQHPEGQTKQQRDKERRRWWTERKTMTREEQKDIMEEIKDNGRGDMDKVQN